MLNPEHVRMRPALRYQVRVLGVRLESALRRHEFGAHSTAPEFPGSASIARFPDTAARDTHDHMPRIARIDTNRMNAWMVRAAAEPFFAARVVPEWPVQSPGIASIVGPEQATRQRAAPDDAGLIRSASSERTFRSIAGE